MGFEGYGADDDYHFNEKEEKKEGWAQAAIWIVGMIIFGVCLLITVYLNVSDLMLMKNGTCAVAELTSSQNTAVFEIDGKRHYASLSSAVYAADNNKVKVYYTDEDAKNAKPVTAAWFYIMMYVVWVPLLIISIRAVYKNVTNKQKHSVPKEGKDKFQE